MFKCISINKKILSIESDIKNLITQTYSTLSTFDDEFKPFYIKSTKPESNKLAIFFHGLGACANQYKFTMETFSNLGYHTLSLALPNHENHHYEKVQLNVKDRKKFIHSVANSLNNFKNKNIDIHFIGTSFGTSFIEEIVRLCPNLTKSVVYISPFLDVKKTYDSLKIRTLDYLGPLGHKIAATLPSVRLSSEKSKVPGWNLIRPENILAAWQQTQILGKQLTIEPRTVINPTTDLVVDSSLPVKYMRNLTLHTLPGYPHNMIMTENLEKRKELITHLVNSCNDKTKLFTKINPPQETIFLPISPRSYVIPGLIGVSAICLTVYYQKNNLNLQ